MNLAAKSFPIYYPATNARHVRDTVFFTLDEFRATNKFAGDKKYMLVILTASEYRELKKLERRNK